MIKLSIKHDFGNGKLRKVTLADFSLGTQQMLHLGLVGLQSIKDRTAKGVGSDDGKMPALGTIKGAVVETKFGKRVVNKGKFSSLSGYAAQKQRLGLQPIRDLRGPGDKYKSVASNGKRTMQRVAYQGGTHMMDDLRVTFAGPTVAKIDITTAMGRVKARANEDTIRRKGGAGWWGFSPRDRQAIMTAARQVLGDVALKIGGFFNPRASRKPIWMDPLGKQSQTKAA